jgi:hypothetical protein
MASKIKKILLFFLKLSLILGIFVYLFWKASGTPIEDGKNVFQILWEQPKRFDFIAGAFLMQLFAVSMTFVRWRWLVQTFGLTLSLKDAFRFGFVGLLLNLAPMGIVGGDLVKSYLLINHNPKYRTQAVASVIVDRIVGLLVMFLLGSVLVCATGFIFRDDVWSKTLSRITLLLTVIGFTCTGIVFLPFFAKGHIERVLEKIPYCGRIAGKLTNSLLLYRHHKICLFQAFLLTFLVHIPFGISLYLIANGLFQNVPGIIDHILLYSTVNLTSMIPLAAGPFELVLNELYHNGFEKGIGIGLVVALAHRLISICVAGVGIVYYLSSKDEIGNIAEFENEPETEN